MCDICLLGPGSRRICDQRFYNILEKHIFFYAFSIILKVLRKIVTDNAEGIVVVPQWPTQPISRPNGRAVVRSAFLRRNVPPQSVEVMCASLSDNTLRQYECAFNRWFNFCSIHNVDPYNSNIKFVIEFLTEIYNKGAQYGTLNSYRSALALILGSWVSSDDILSRLFKGFFRLRPPMPKYNVTWDTSIVLDYLANFYPNSDIDLETLSKKLITLFALVTAHRVQTLSFILVKNISINNLSVSIKTPDILKKHQD